MRTTRVPGRPSALTAPGSVPRLPSTCARVGAAGRRQRMPMDSNQYTRDAVRDGTRPEGRLPSASALVIVEGISDQVALETLAVRRGRDLAAEGIAIVPIGGAQRIGRFLEPLLASGRELRLAGLCDAGEESVFRRGLERAGLGSGLTRTTMERLGFYVCVEDLEDELIRSLGATAVEDVLEAHGHLGSFRTYQKQRAHQRKAPEAQLRGFLGNYKARYGRFLVEALDLDRVPRPLDGVLAHL